MAAGYDSCVHLAVMNNDAAASIDDFRAANVEALQKIWQVSRNAGLRHFINISTFHAGLSSRSDPYSVSKREADAWLLEESRAHGGEIILSTILLPAVYSDSMRGGLAIIGSFPRPFRPALLAIAGALKPIVDIGLVSETIAKMIENPRAGVTPISNDIDRNPAYRLVTALCNWGVILAVGLLLWWALIIIAVAIRLESRGPAIFAQTRVGKHGKPFTCYKFRTMRLGTPQLATHNVSVSAVTRLGSVLRKLKFDELPQIVNIARGEMRVVGPRPCLPSQSELIEARRSLGVLDMRPGITGWAQINDVDMSDPPRLAAMDRDYMAMRSFLFDLSIMIKTVVGAGRQDRVAV